MTPTILYTIIVILSGLLLFTWVLLSKAIYKLDEIEELYTDEAAVTAALEYEVNQISDLIVSIKELPTGGLNDFSDMGRIYNYVKNTIRLVVVEKTVG